MKNMKASALFKSVLVLILFLFFLNCSKSNEEKFYSSVALATAAPIATDIGVQVFEKGGNAFDVAVAVGFVLAVVHPEAGNLGGGGFALIRDGKSGEIKALDFRETAPLAAHEKMFQDSAGNVIKNLSTVGALSVGVPGTVAGLHELWKECGSLAWSELISYSVALADTGFILDKYQSDHFKEYHEKLKFFEETSSFFFPNGRVLEPGERLTLPDLAKSLRQISKNGPAAFYTGEIADSIVATMKNHGGVITHEDLKNYSTLWRSPMNFTFDSFQVFTMPPPSSGGIVMGQILKILEKYDFSRYTAVSPEYIHLFCESARLAYADRSEHLGDPDFHKIPPFLLSEEYLTNRAKFINMNHANTSQEIKPGLLLNSDSKQTTHFSVADRGGNLVALTYTLNSSYGSKLAVRGCGFLLNNEMDDFAIAPGHANLYGLVGGEANKIEPRKRMLSSMSPTIVLKNNQPFLILGSPGGSEIITAAAQCILNLTRFDMSLPEALAQPRFHHQWLPDVIELEANSFDITVKQGLIKLGHNIEEFEPSSEIQAVYIDERGLITGAADPRQRGTFAGF